MKNRNNKEGKMNMVLSRKKFVKNGMLALCVCVLGLLMLTPGAVAAPGGNEATPTRVKDMRDYIQRLKAIGEIQEIKEEVDWNLEMGAIIRWCNENGAPAPLFTNVKGSKDFRVLGAPMGVSRQKGLFLSRLAISAGLPPTASGSEIVEAFVKAYDNYLVNPIKPVAIKNGPCKENILLGKDVDLFRIPVPMAHDGDGGRYINTWGTIIAQSPDGEWVNWSINRIMVVDNKTMVGSVSPAQHLGHLQKQWREKGFDDVPVAIVFGGEPFIPLVTGSTLVPSNQNEANFIGSYFGAPMELVKCETSDIMVPANAEIVIEARLSTNDRTTEGPMGEYPGYVFLGETRQLPVYYVDAITYRNNPIYPVVVAGAPIDETHIAMGVGACAEILHSLRKHGIPATMTWMPFEAALHWGVITLPLDWQAKMNCSTEDLMKRIREALVAVRGSFLIPKVIVLNDDIDPTNISDVIWAFATRHHPSATTIFPDFRTMPLVAYLSPEEKRAVKSPLALYNCLWPGDRKPVKSDFNNCYPPDIKERALDKLKRAGAMK